MIKNINYFKTNLMNLYHTIKYLRWSQIWFLIYYRMGRLRLTSQMAMRRRPWQKAWEPVYRELPPSIFSLNDVLFLEEPGSILEKKDWNCPKKSKLWLYNLHYLDDLVRQHAPTRHSLLHEFILKWIKENPPGKGNGWEPYPLSLRLVNLVKWYSSTKIFISLVELRSLAQQTQALIKQLEYHIRGNHLFSNAKALVFMGTFFEGSEADRWLRKGLKILDKELTHQFLLDGAHYELSPMYHAMLLWDLCDLVHLAHHSGVRELLERKNNWQAKIVSGLKWLELMSHPDGNISFFNDAAFGIAPTWQELQTYAKQLGIDDSLDENTSLPKDYLVVHALKESGYCIVHAPFQSKAILDVGKIGPDEQPGHAHADSLSFELSLFGQRVLVNSGTSQYGNDSQRQLQRGTKAHNALMINGEDSSEVWAGFRVARRAYPKNLSIQQEKERVSIHCSHTGYLRLPGQNLHHRQWTFAPRQLIIHDHLTGNYHAAEARFYFHPEITVTQSTPDTIKCVLMNENVVIIKVQHAKKIVVEPSLWYPYFGKSMKNQCLVMHLSGHELITAVEW